METVKSSPTEVWIIGVDEVGRGPLAGPVTVAAVAAPILKPESWSLKLMVLNGIRDSKKLSSLQRGSWNKKIRTEFTCAIASVSPQMIDKRSISVAVKLAVSRCLIKLLRGFRFQDSGFRIVLDGGLKAPSQYKNQQTIIKGDERVPIIAAASIVAKVHRDKYMTRLAKKYPQYGFDVHKGYGTVMHRRAIIKYGLSEAHRETFCKRFI